MAIAVDYVIFLTDLTKVQQFNTQYPNGVQIPPNAAASTYGVPGPSQGTNNLNQTGGIGIFPGGSLGYAAELSGAFNTEAFTVTFNDNNPPPAGFPDPYPITLSCYWVGTFAYVGQPNTAPPAGTTATPRYLGARYWADGFEVPTLGDGAVSGQGTHKSRDASRTPEGIGYAYRNGNNSANITHTLPSPQPTVLWQRFYIRPRVLPTGGDDNIMYIIGTIDAGADILLNINTTGTLQGYFMGNAAYPGQSAGTSTALTVGTWYRIDVRVELLQGVNPYSPHASMAVYINGVLSFSGNDTALNVASNSKISTATLGENASATANGLEMDFDDWIGAAEVTITNSDGSQSKFPGMDLTSGSHVVLVRPTGFGPNHQTANWTDVGGLAGDFREVNTSPASTEGVSSGLLTTTPKSILHVTTDYLRQQSGVACISVAVFEYQSSGGTAKLQISASPTINTITPAALTWSGISAAYTVSNGATADALSDPGSMTITYTSDTGVGTTTITGLFSTAEFIGSWGTEDTVLGLPGFYNVRVGIHNSPYPDTQGNHSRHPPVSGVRITSGVYIGNGDGQDLFESIPAHWYWVRPITPNTDGVFWFSSMLSAHGTNTQKLVPHNMAQAVLTNQNRPKLEISGSDSRSNSNLSRFQFIAVEDLGMRFMLNGAFAHKANVVATLANALIDSAFTPDCVFFMREDFTAGTLGGYFKGPGNATDTASAMDGTGQISGVASVSAGTITSKSLLHSDIPQTAFSAWRKSDGSGAAQWFDTGSYVGTGVVQNIAVVLGGKIPQFVLVVAHNNSGPWARDPSHTGTHSWQIGSGDVTTTITGVAANQFTVDGAANTNGVTYEFFVLQGGTSVANATYTVAGEAVRAANGPWVTAPVQAAVNPVTLTTPAQWRIHRVDLERREEEEG